MEKKTVTVEIPVEVIAQHYMGLGKFMQVFPVREMNANNMQFHTCEISDSRIGGLTFLLKRNGETLRHEFLSWETIFGLAARVEKLLDGAGFNEPGWQHPMRCIAYEVKEGDTLSALAKKFLGDAERFMEIWNDNSKYLRGKNPSEIYPGERLVIFLQC